MFKKWCLENYTTNINNATHVFMDNGKIHVPDDKYSEFLKRYYNALCAGEHPSIVERVGPQCLFRFFLDIDLKNCNVQDALFNIYEKANKLLNIVGDIYVCNENKGVHVIYNKVVDCTKAITLGTFIRDNIDACYQKCIDLSVYKTGLRMIGAYKNTELRYYIPYNNQFSWETFKHSILRVKSIIPIATNETSKKNTNFKNIEFFLKDVFELKFVCVKSIKKYGNFINCATNSKYCENIQRYHKNANVYYVFNLSERICYQKCFCTCEAQMPFTSCRNFKSKSHNVPYILISYLQSF